MDKTSVNGKEEEAKQAATFSSTHHDAHTEQITLLEQMKLSSDWSPLMASCFSSESREAGLDN